MFFVPFFFCFSALFALNALEFNSAGLASAGPMAEIALRYIVNFAINPHARNSNAGTPRAVWTNVEIAADDDKYFATLVFSL